MPQEMQVKQQVKQKASACSAKRPPPQPQKMQVKQQVMQVKQSIDPLRARGQGEARRWHTQVDFMLLRRSRASQRPEEREQGRGEAVRGVLTTLTKPLYD